VAQAAKASCASNQEIGIGGEKTTGRKRKFWGGCAGLADVFAMTAKRPSRQQISWLDGRKVFAAVRCLLNPIRLVLLGLDGEGAESDIDGLRFLVTSDTHRERVCAGDQTIAGEDNPLVRAAYGDAVASCDESRLL